jgi:hypothetical protein
VAVGLGPLIATVRPNWKERYPLIRIRAGVLFLSCQADGH